jgi:hypothetical protein
MSTLPKIVPPSDESFGGKDFLPAPDIEAVAEDLRERHNLSVEPTIRYLWKKRGGKKGGAPKRGWCQKLSGPAKHFAGEAHFVIWLAADTLREAKFTQTQLRALTFHELQFVGVEYDEETGDAKMVSRGVDFEGFLDEIRVFGLWEDNLIAAGAEFKQAPLFDADAGPTRPGSNGAGGGLAAVDRAVARVFAP